VSNIVRDAFIPEFQVLWDLPATISSSPDDVIQKIGPCLFKIERKEDEK
jgi:hypothetical protein